MTAAIVSRRVGSQSPKLRLDDSPADLGLPVLLVGAVVLGGGAWNGGDVALALGGVASIGGGYWRQLCRRPADRWGRSEWLVVIALLLLAVTQLVPLPVSWMDGLPGRDAVAADLEVAGIEAKWRPWSLDASGAFRSIAALLPAVAMFLLAFGASDSAILRACRALVGICCVAVTLGVIQVLDGPDSAMRLHGFHNRSGALGFFSYRNAFAAALVMTMPFAAALMLVNTANSGQNRASPRWLWGGALALLLIGVALTYSRAGAMLAALSICGCGLLHVSTRRRAGQLIIITIAVALGLALAAVFSTQSLLGDATANLRDDGRWELYREVMATASPYLPWGAGLGSFEQVFQSSTLNLTYVDAYMNHAHNDWAQLLLELGWPGLIVAISLLALFFRAARRVWTVKLPASREVRPESLLLARAASIVIALVLLHSYFDYPLRTGSNLVVFAFAAGILWRSHRALNLRKHVE